MYFIIHVLLLCCCVFRCMESCNIEDRNNDASIVHHKVGNMKCRDLIWQSMIRQKQHKCKTSVWNPPLLLGFCHRCESDAIHFVLYRCRELNVNKNHFTSFKQLPKIPQIQHLSLAENNIATLSGISDFRHTPLESLILKRNPCEFQERYRQL